jgi:cyclopropane-fatty-acyl-phospholipid synthase
MMSDRFAEATASVLSKAGIEVNGGNPWDIRVHNQRFYRGVLAKGSLGLGESYVDGWWDCEKLDEFFFKVVRSRLADTMRKSPAVVRTALLARAANMQSRRRAFHIATRHYDLGNDLFSAMLDDRMVYSCAYWKGCQTLGEAQEAKMDLICRKLQLEPGMTILDIGCGWGSLANYAAEKYGVSVVGITVSQEQVDWARRHARTLPIDIRLQDYREINGTFDRIVSVGMFEHVGYKNYRTFMMTVHRCLRDDGLVMLHTIGGNRSVVSVDPWIGRYVFPNGMLPSIRQIGRAMEGLFVMEDWHNFSADYDRTLMEWHRNFENAWGRLHSHYDERFHRIWRYYLLSCAGAFRARGNQLWQIVLSKQGIVGGYRSIR